MSAEEIPETLQRLIGHHPAALRTVCWRTDPLQPGEFSHLELEAKHGQVVVIDHTHGTCHAEPPLLPGADALMRQQRDLTSHLPGAFHDRPRFSGFTPLMADGRLEGWRIDLSTGRHFNLTLDGETPLILPDES